MGWDCARMEDRQEFDSFEYQALALVYDPRFEPDVFGCVLYTGLTPTGKGLSR